MSTDEIPPHRSLVDAALARLAPKIAPLVRAELSALLLGELERHFREQLLPVLHPEFREYCRLYNHPILMH